MWQLEGKVVLITGGARGMGESTARLFVASGARVVIGDLLDDAGHKLAAELGEAAAFHHLDVASPDDWSRIVAFAQSRFGKLDALVNNAGIEKTGDIASFAFEDYQRVIAVNQTGVWLGMKLAFPALKAAGGGAIVNISSVAGLQGIHGYSAYCASKWAVRGMTKAAALEFGAHGIRVNSIHPGTIDTPMNAAMREYAQKFCETLPVPRMGRPEEVAQLIAFLISEASAYCTGGEYLIDGGMLAGPKYG